MNDLDSLIENQNCKKERKIVSIFRGQSDDERSGVKQQRVFFYAFLFFFISSKLNIENIISDMCIVQKCLNDRTIESGRTAQQLLF